MKKSKEQTSLSPYTEKTDPWSSHSIIQNWLLDFPPGTKVLDIGTATGIIGRKCAGCGFILKGIEPIEDWVEIARPFYNDMIGSSIENAPDDFIAAQDLIIFGDVLEHTAHPERILERIISLQSPETQYFISIPNIANLWIRLNLLFGKFNYTENGILDKTHLRFFTKATFLVLIKNSGLKVIDFQCTPVPLPLVHPFFQDHAMGRLIHKGLAMLTRLLPGLLAYQFVARLNRSQEGDHQ